MQDERIFLKGRLFQGPAISVTETGGFAMDKKQELRPLNRVWKVLVQGKVVGADWQQICSFTIPRTMYLGVT